MKISIKKSNFFTKRVRWCGRLIDGKGYQFDPRNLSGLQNPQLPQNAGELSEFVHCLQWMASSIPDFSSRFAPLKDIMEEAHSRSGSRTKRSIQSISLASLSWGRVHEQLFREFQQELQNMTTLSDRNTEKALRIYTDALEEYWAGVVTQGDSDELDKDLKDQQHEPLEFLGAAFKGSEERWTTYEKEAYAIYQVFKKMDYMLLVEGEIHLYTDHRNLLFVVNRQALHPTLGRNVVSKVQRWGLFLSRFSYGIEHVDGESNVMADIMTRWWRGYRGKRQTARRITHLLLEKDFVASPLQDTFQWPDAITIAASQKRHSKEVSEKVNQPKGNMWNINGKVWIPSKDCDMQMKLLVIAHCGQSGHRGKEATLSILKES